MLQPAIDYAEKGYPLSPVLGKYWALAYKSYRQKLIDDEFQPWFDTFAPNNLAQALARMGHEIEVTVDTGSFGRGQIIILRDAETGVLVGGTEARTDGSIAAW